MNTDTLRELRATNAELDQAGCPMLLKGKVNIIELPTHLGGIMWGVEVLIYVVMQS